MDTQKHSGLGIASFVGSMLGGILGAGLLVVAGVLETITPGGLGEDSVSAMIIGLSLFAVLGLAFTALVLGICGLCQKERKRVFATLGTIFSGLTIFGLGAIVVLGIVAG